MNYVHIRDFLNKYFDAEIVRNIKLTRKVYSHAAKCWMMH